ncbi:MAG TPA: peptidoglycan-associated lipoprotein Pal [Thermoanaerobaculia bacterium]|jgi:peptidoglycan-associated lipoprotein|nr:peptidoglycan-associated lipoprotein Pal [Thermoanaerobaculia bacterium]
MNRNWIVWIVIPVLAVFLFGCPKKKPATPAEDLNVETTTVTPPPTTTPTQDVEQTAPSTTNDQTENPLMSEDMQVVNDELRRRGFAADIYFQLDEAGLSDEARSQLQRNADLLRQAQFSLTVEGHADSRGTNEYNVALGERRATAVKDYLGSLGVAADRLRTLSYGEERPVCTTEEESCWSQNRRAHLVITGRANVG